MLMLIQWNGPESVLTTPASKSELPGVQDQDRFAVSLHTLESDWQRFRENLLEPGEDEDA
jgi:hypothetical protein